MLIRICLAIAIIAGLAVGGLNFVKVKEKVTTLQANLKEQTEGRQKAETELASTKSDLEKTTANLKKTEASLTEATEVKDKAVAEAETQKKRADRLNDDLNKTRNERDGAQADLAAFKATGLSPEQIVSANKVIKNLQAAVAENEVIIKARGQEIKRLGNELARFLTPDKPVLLPPSCTGKVVATDPKWKFVILNIGENQGMLQYGELLVNREGKLVGKVKVTTVEKDRSVANVLPGWPLGDVIEGDSVIPAHPAS
jgi:hypothetical protein